MNLKKVKKDYIPATNHWKEIYRRFSEKDDLWDYIPLDRIPVKKIRIDKTLLDYPNDVDENEVTYMIENFYKGAWDPIMVNENYFILDGQHRLRLAQRVGLKYIDVMMRKRKSPEITRKMQEYLEVERKHQKEIERLLGFAL